MTVAAADTPWPGFRGDGRNIAEQAEPPTTWSDDQSIAWQTKLDGYGQSSPVVFGESVFVTSISGKSKEKGLVAAYEIKSGARRWLAEVPASQLVPDGDMVSRGAPTPCVDDRAVYTFFESGDLAAFDHGGKQLWHRKLAAEYGEYKGNHGLGGSPVQSSDAIFLLVDHDGPSYLLAVDKITGKNLWKTDRPSKISWSSPLYITAPVPAVVISSNGSVEAYSAVDGKQLWSVPELEGNTVASPTLAGDRLIIGSSDPGETRALNWQTPSKQPEVAWRLEKLAASFSSPLAYRDQIYLVNKSGVAACVDSKTGEALWTERLPGSCWATPLGAAGRVYFFGKDGTTTVVAAGSKFERLAENRLTIEGRVYGAAAVRGALLLRAGEKLICVGHP
ncbi:MAG: PQQ-binding-like beta-propeller repeat protein [Pirellulales bacterium]